MRKYVLILYVYSICRYRYDYRTISRLTFANLLHASQAAALCAPLQVELKVHMNSDSLLVRIVSKGCFESTVYTGTAAPTRKARRLLGGLSATDKQSTLGFPCPVITPALPSACPPKWALFHCSHDNIIFTQIKTKIARAVNQLQQVQCLPFKEPLFMAHKEPHDQQRTRQGSAMNAT